MCCVYVHVYARVSLGEFGGVYREGASLSFVLCDLAEFLLEMQFLRGYFPQSIYLLSGHSKKKLS